MEDFDLNSKIQPIKPETSILFISSGSFPPLLTKITAWITKIVGNGKTALQVATSHTEAKFLHIAVSPEHYYQSINEHIKRPTHPYTAISSSSSSLSALSLCFPYLLHETLRTLVRESMAKVKVTLEVGNDGVAVITIFNPPVNALAIPRNQASSAPYLIKSSTIHSSGFDFLFFGLFFRDAAVIAGLKEKFDEVARRNDVRAIVLTGN